MGISQGGSFLGNLMMGIYQGQQAQQHHADLLRAEEMKNELQKLQVEHYKSQTARETKKLELEAQKMALFQNLLPQMAQPAAAGPEQLSGPDMPEPAAGPIFGPGFENQQPQGGGGNVTNMMARLQAMDPMQLAALKEATGLDVVPGMNMVRGGEAEKRQQAEFLYRQNKDTIDRLVNAGAVTYGEEQDPKTGTIRTVPRFTNPTAAATFLGGGGSAGGLGMSPPSLGGGGIKSIPKPEERVTVRDGIEYTQPVNPFNNEPMGPERVTKPLQPLAGTAAGQVGMLQSGQDALNKAKAILMPNGVIDKQSYKILAQSTANIPWSEGRHYNGLIADTIEGKLRLESGAAVPKEEVERIGGRFKPSPMDSPATIQDKLDRLERFNRGTVELLDPNQRYSKSVDKFKAENGKTYVVKPDMKLTTDQAKDYLTKAKGDPNKARELAKAAGWEF